MIVSIVVPVSAYVVSKQQQKVYLASAKVLVSRQDLGSAVTGVPSAAANTDPDRVARTQAEIARSVDVAERAIKNSGVTGLTAAGLLANSSVTPETTADILRFGVEQESQSAAVKLANGYALAYAQNKYRQDTETIASAASELDKRLAELRRGGLTATQVYQEPFRAGTEPAHVAAVAGQAERRLAGNEGVASAANADAKHHDRRRPRRPARPWCCLLVERTRQARPNGG